MKTKLSLSFVFFAISTVIAAQQNAPNPEYLIQIGKYKEAANIYSTYIQTNNVIGKEKELADACIGLYKVLWINHLQDKLDDHFKPCSKEAMDWLQGKVNRDATIARQPNIVLPTEFLRTVSGGTDLKLVMGFDVTETGQIENVIIISSEGKAQNRQANEAFKIARENAIIAMKAAVFLPKISDGKAVRSNEMTYFITQGME